MIKIITRFNRCIVLLLLWNCQLAGQGTIVFKNPVVKIDFGSRSSKALQSAGRLKHYEQINGSCPDDGYYAFVTSTSECFGGNWITVPEDHTPGDVAGKMMIVNAAETPGAFFTHSVVGLTPGAHYELAAWLVNICFSGSGCRPTPPNISISVISGGQTIAAFNTGTITATGSPNWQRYYGRFTMPSGNDRIEITMSDYTEGGCGNDFAMDDISIREFIIIPPPVIEKPKKPTPPPPNKKPPPAKPTAPEPIVKKPEPAPIKKSVLQVEQVVKPGPVKAAPIPVQKTIVPPVLQLRSNPVVKKIETGAGELLIELYDNGEVDGDTVTVFHNNKLVISRAGISEKPVQYRLKVDASQPHHELIMVAENLGTIPPNTSLMIITVKDKRHEIFITSSNDKNARILIDLKE